MGLDIKDLLWFLGALASWGAYALYLRGWRRERLEHLMWLQRYDAASQERHEESLRAIALARGEDLTCAWNLSSKQRGQA